MTTKSDRHAMIETSCEWCKEKFLARRERVEKGQSRFCSMIHYREWKKSQGLQSEYIGKENAFIKWDNKKNMYVSYWYDKDTFKYKSQPWGRWAWELSFGSVPSGYRVSYKDGNPRNNVLENLFLKHVSEYKEIGDFNRGVPKPKETREKLSASHSGKTLSEEHKKRIGDANRKKWAAGLFDTVHKGKYNKHWRGGVEKGYTYDFESLRVFVRDRDNYMCQICGKHLHKTRDSHVHHIDGNKKHNEMDNLILLCTACHGKVHAKNPAPPSILAFRDRLEWNHNDIIEQDVIK